MENRIKAWHFCADTLRDGSPIPADGVVLSHPGEAAWAAAEGELVNLIEKERG